MKYLYIGIGLLVVTLICALICLWLLHTYIDDAIIHLDTAIEAYDNGQIEAAEQAAQKAISAWDRHEGFINAMLDHAETDSVKWKLTNIRSYATTGDKNEFRAVCEEARAMMEHIYETERLHYFNFL